MTDTNLAQTNRSRIDKLEEDQRELRGSVEKLKVGMDVLKERTKLPELKSAWMDYLITPLDEAYESASTSVDKTLKDVQDKIQRRINLALTAFSLCTGSVMTAVFARLTLAASSKGVIDQICKTRLEKLLWNAKCMGGNSTAQFIMGSFWQGAGNKLSQKTRLMFDEKTKDNFQSASNFSLNANNLSSHLKAFVRQSYKKVADMLDNCFDEGKTRAEVEGMLDIIKTSPLFCPPSEQYLPSTAKLAKIIELSFYLRMVLNSDFRIYAQLTDHGPGTWVTWKKEDIHMSANSSDYLENPIPKARQQDNERTRVAYRYIDPDIVKKMNQICWDFYQYDHPVLDLEKYGGNPNRESLIKAERLLKKIENETWSALNDYSAKI